uniref:Uncharacterized protein n=1 Tax=Moniliophthora roreri TaxID=221103 RepID=A0A0W0FY85_MONRR
MPTKKSVIWKRPAKFPMPLPTPPESSPAKPVTPQANQPNQLMLHRGSSAALAIMISDDDSDEDTGAKLPHNHALSPIELFSDNEVAPSTSFKHKRGDVGRSNSKRKKANIDGR